MRQIGIIFAILILTLFVGTESVRAGTLVTQEEAKAMAVAAADLLRAEGDVRAFNAFNNDPKWRDRDAYVVVIDAKGVCLANSLVKDMRNKQVVDLKDVDGRTFIRDIISVQGEAWVEYKWMHPLTKRMATKKSYTINVGDRFVFVGAYEEQ